jgi:hypothetical protein
MRQTCQVGTSVEVGACARAASLREGEGAASSHLACPWSRSVQAHPRLVPRSVVWSMCAALLLLTTRGSAADPLGQWQWRNPLPNGDILEALTYASNQFVAVGAGGALAISQDAIHWTYGNCGPIAGLVRYDLLGITYGDGRFVAVGAGSPSATVNGAGVVLVSADGRIWQAQTLPVGPYGPITMLKSVSFGNGTFVAVGEAGDQPSQLTYGVVLTSLNGIDWTIQPTAFPDNLSAVTFGNGTFVVVTQNSFTALADTVILTSVDGMNWDPSDAGTTESLFAVGFGANRFVAVGGDVVSSTDDGDTWTEQLSRFTAGSTSRGVAYGDGTFVAVGGDQVLTSTNAPNWVKQTVGADPFLLAVAYGSGRFVACGIGALLVSTNGFSWSNLVSGPLANLSAVAHGNGIFVALAAGGSTLSSSDGSRWTLGNVAQNNGAFVSIGYGQSTFVAVGSRVSTNFAFVGAIATSTNGVNWVARDAGNVGALWGVGYGNGLFVVCGNDSLLTSSNAVDWSPQFAGNGNRWWATAYGNDVFVVVGDGGSVLSRASSGTWRLRFSGAGGALRGVAYGNGAFVAVGDGGTIVMSTNGVDWCPANSGVGTKLSNVDYAEGTFVAVGDGGTVLTSTNGEDWVQRDSGTANQLFGVTFGEQTFVVVGNTGTVLQSAQLPVLPPGERLVLGPILCESSGATVVTAAGTSGTAWEIQTSTDLMNWLAWRTIMLTNDTMQMTDTNTDHFSRRFYRGVSQRP